MSAPNDDPRDIRTLLAIMARLRAPQGGCPWDLEQTFATIAPYTIEEAYEVADAIARGDRADLKDELGDLLFQVVFHAQMAAEEKAFAFADVVEAISSKMIRRHPHVFGDATVETADAQTIAWEEHKRREREARAARAAPAGAAGAPEKSAGVLDNVPLALPALTRALKLQKRAAQVGFDWRERNQVLAKLAEEIQELGEAAAAQADNAKLTDEMGDILFVCVNLARHLGVDPETALRSTNEKFVRRFHYVEEAMAERGQTPAQSTLSEMDEAWNEAKRREKR